MPSESEPVYVEPAPEEQVGIFQGTAFCKKAFQGLMLSPQAWGIHSTQKINDRSYNQLVSDPATFVRNVHNDLTIRPFRVTWPTWWARDQVNISV